MRKLIDLTGQRFGRLTVISRAENGKSGQVRWNCICECGVKIMARGGNLLSGNTKSCGCLQKEGKIIDLTGQRFGRLVVVSRAENSKAGHPRWNCVCDCGGTTIADGQNLRNGHTRSCGCLIKEGAVESFRTHGMHETPTYGIWSCMKQRCTNPKHPSYKDYGGRGIKVCERWSEFENFYEDMGEEPRGLSLERKNNNGNYCPENCIYATQKEQTRNTRRTVLIEYQGKTQCMKDWAKELGINYATLRFRLQKHSPRIAFNM